MTAAPGPDLLKAVPLRFGLTSLFADMTYELAHVLLPSLMLHLGGTGMATALMESLAEGTKMAGFWTAGHLGRNPEKESLLVRTGYALTVLGTVLMGAAGSAGALIALKSLSWFGKGLRGPARDALLTNALPADLHAAAFGIVRGLDQTGGLIGPLLALGLSGLLSPSRILFLTIVPGVLCVAYSVSATRTALRARIETDHQSVAGQEAEPASGEAPLHSHALRAFLLGGVLLRAGMFPATLLMFRFADSGGSFPVTVGGFLLSSLMTVGVNLAIARRRLSSSPRILLGASGFLISLSALLLSGTHPAPILYLLAMTAWGSGEALASVGLKVRGAILWPPALRTRGFALFERMAAFLSLLFWPLAAHLWDLGQTEAGMGMAAAAAATGGLILARSPDKVPQLPAS